jgi:hypothetical protein
MDLAPAVGQIVRWPDGTPYGVADQSGVKASPLYNHNKTSQHMPGHVEYQKNPFKYQWFARTQKAQPKHGLASGFTPGNAWAGSKTGPKWHHTEYFRQTSVVPA